MTRAGAVHDVELAPAGRNSEDVAAGPADGSFGMAKETARFIQAAAAERLGSFRPRSLLPA